MTGGVTRQDRAVVLTGVVDERAVARLADPGAGRREVDLRAVTGWTPDGLRAVSSLLDGHGDGARARVLAPRHASFLELLREAELGETWSLYRDVHRILAASRARDTLEAR